MGLGVYQVDCVVIGAGVVGLAVARALALQGREVLVLLYAYCAERGVRHSRRGTLIVTTSDSQVAQLASIRPTAAAKEIGIPTT